MRIAVISGTGVVGRHTVEALRRVGHDIIVVARARGVNVLTGDVLADIVAGPPRGRATDLAGPEPQDLVDMARRTLSAQGESIRLIPSWRNGVFGVEAAGEVLLAGPEVQLAPTTFDAWLARQSTTAPLGS